MSNQLDGMIKLLNIKCKTCLDTKVLWKNRDNVFFARMDGRGEYDVNNCNVCSGGGWNRCSTTNEIYINDIRVLYVNDGDQQRINALEKKADTVLRLKNALEKANELDRIKSEEQKENDNNPEPLWYYSKNEKINKQIKNLEIDMEIGKIAEKVYDAIKVSSGDVFELTELIKELKVEMKVSMESSNTVKRELKQVKDAEGRFTYIVFEYSNKIEIIFSECLEWCGFNTRTNNFSLDYTILKPKNKAAQNECDRHMTRNVKLN